MADAPTRRRVEMEIKLGADDWHEAARALDAIAHRIFEAKQKGEDKIKCVSGGYTSGWTLTADEDESVTGESYRDALKRWKKDRDDG